jgi:exodeoxyribonuclease V alpha subunit
MLAAVDAAQQGSGEVLQGTVERVTYADPGTLYCVLRVAPEKGYAPTQGQSPFLPSLVTAVGRVESPGEGARVRLSGRWGDHKTHGRQFEFELLEVLAPADRAGLVKYLASDRFSGIGPKLAERIVDALGQNALEEVLEHPEKLAGVKGLRPAIRDGLVAAVLAETGNHRAQVFLRGLGLGPWQANAVVRALGFDGEERVRANPYVLASGIPGIGFGTADRIAKGLGIEGADPRRARAGLVTPVPAKPSSTRSSAATTARPTSSWGVTTPVPVTTTAPTTRRRSSTTSTSTSSVSSR